MKFPRTSFLLVLLGMLALLPEAKALNLQIPTRPTQFPLEIDINQGAGCVVAPQSSGDSNLVHTVNGLITNALNNVVQVTPSGNLMAALKADGSISTWWPSSSNQIAATLPNVSNIVQISGQFALKNDGTIIVFNTNSIVASIPSGISNIVQIDAGGTLAAALKSDGTVVAWKWNQSNSSAISISGLSDVVQIATGVGNVALKSDGTVVAWDTNGVWTNQLNLQSIVQVTVDGNYVVGALRSDGVVFTESLNPNYPHPETTIPYTWGTNAVQIGASGYWLALLTSNGFLVDWPSSLGANRATYYSNAIAFTLISSGINSIYEILNLPNQTISPFSQIGNQTYGIPFNIAIPTATSSIPVALSVKAGSVIINSNVITPTSVGTIILAANQAGNTNVNAAPEVTTSFTVAQGSQTITPFQSIPNQSYSTDPIWITPPTSSSGLPVSMTVTGPATLNGNSLTLTGVGTVNLFADQAGNTNYKAAPEVSTNFTVTIASQTISPLGSIPPQVVGVTFTLSPTASSGLPVTLSIKSGPATVSSNTITPTGVGTVVVAANQSGNANYNPAPEVTASFTVKNFNQGIANFKTIPPKNYPCPPFAVTLPKATSGLPVTLSVISGPATVKGNTVTVTTAGVVVLGANQGGNSKYNSAPQVTTSFSVGTKTTTQKITPFKKIPNKTHGTSFTITLPTASSGLPVAVTVQSGNATINGNTLTLTGTGYVTLAADQGGNQYFNPAPEVTTTFFVQ